MGALCLKRSGAIIVRGQILNAFFDPRELELMQRRSSIKKLKICNHNDRFTGFESNKRRYYRLASS